MKRELINYCGVDRAGNRRAVKLFLRDAIENEGADDSDDLFFIADYVIIYVIM